MGIIEREYKSVVYKKYMWGNKKNLKKIFKDK